MRVLNSLIDSRIGGPHLRALDVANQLRHQDIETVFLLPQGPDEFEDLASKEGFQVERPGLSTLSPIRDIRSNTKYLLNLIYESNKIIQIIKQQDIDLVHASMTLNFQAALAAYRSSVPLTWFFNDIGTPWPLNRITGVSAQVMAQEISVAADAVHSHFFGDNVNTRTIYPPVDTEKFRPRKFYNKFPILRNEFDIKRDTPIIGTIGNLNPVKGHEYLFKAISYVKEHYDTIVVLIAGSILDSRNNYFERIKHLSQRLDLEDTVYFLGHRSDIPAILASLDVFVLSSIKEASPISVLEAMAMQCAIVATQVGGIPEQIIDGKHGWLVPARDTHALGKAIHEALESPNERRRRGTAARERAKIKFSLEECTKRHVDMYKNAFRK